MRSILATFLAALLTLGSAVAYARQCAGVNMPGSVTVEGTSLQLNGMGIREATVLQVNVYVAGLYLEQRSRNAAEILASDTKKRIHLAFVHDVERADVVQALRDGFRANAPGTSGGDISRLTGWMQTMHEGDSMTFTYVPGTGTEVKVNGSVKGTIEGFDFARGVFSLYIGRRPPNPGLRTGLLGGRCG